MSRRPGNPSRRFGDSGGGLFSSSKSRSSTILPVGLIILGGLFFIAYMYKGSGGIGSRLDSVSRVEGAYWWPHMHGLGYLLYLAAVTVTFLIGCRLAVHDDLRCPSSCLGCVWFGSKNEDKNYLDEFHIQFFIHEAHPGDYLCSGEVQRAIPILQKAYGDSMHKVLHVGPDSCFVVSRLLKEEETEAWGIEPYDIEDADSNCKALIHRGSVRVADIKFPLAYRPKSFSLVIVSDALDYLSPRYLNKTLPDLARVSADGIVIFTGFPANQKAKVADVSKFGRAAKMRSSSWWIRFFSQINLEENEAAFKKFERASTKGSYAPRCQIFHLKSLH